MMLVIRFGSRLSLPRYISLVLAASFLLILSCKNSGTSDSGDMVSTFREEENLFEELDSTTTGINFFNLLHESEEYNYMHYYYLYIGSGVAVGDINNDGLQDIFFNGIMTPNRLYLNKGNFQFQDISLQAGITGGIGIKTGVTMADVNQDGLLDIYVCKSALKDETYRKNELYINNGNLTFTERAAEYGLDDAGYSTQAYFFDAEYDGDPDVFVLNHREDQTQADNLLVVQGKDGQLELAKPKVAQFQSNRLYINNNGKFTDVTEKAGLASDAFGLSATIFDINEDHLPDIYVCNDFVASDVMYINNGDGTYTDRFEEYFTHCSFSSMGSDCADINNDGCLDLMTVDMVPEDNYRKKMLSMVQNYTKYQTMVDVGIKPQFSLNTLHLNQCNGKFSDIAKMTGTAFTDWSWSVLMEDFNNDTHTDIYVSNGFYRDLTNNDYKLYKLDSLNKLYNQGKLTLLEWIKQVPSVKVSSYFFRNSGNLEFHNTSSIWNSGKPDFSNASASADLNNDGYLDLVVNNLNGSPVILKNHGKEKLKHHFLRVTLRDGNKDVGLATAKLTLPDGTMLTRLFHPTKGYMGRSEETLHFGLGKHTQIQKLEITWSDGRVQVETPKEIDKTITITRRKDLPVGEKAPFDPIFEVEELKHIRHLENNYIDFKREPLLHQKYSEEGPGVASGDVNGDSLIDFYLGGSTGIAGQLFVQTPEGQFRKSSVPAFEVDRAFEDNAALFFDSDNDGDLDLYVASGGNEFVLSDSLYTHRLYVNNGNGGFTRNFQALPAFLQSGGVVVDHDIDGDGDLDLFVGGRVQPGRCPEPPASYLLENTKGKFTDATNRWASMLTSGGMVTSATFADLNLDGVSELIYTGEWMPIKILHWNGKQYEDRTDQWGIQDWKGWWYTLHVEDINGDRFPDILAGNLGLNNELNATPEKPVTMWYNDYDKNGTVDPILCYYNGGESYPIHIRDRMLDQMVMLKKKFTRHEAFAGARYEDIFTDAQREGEKQLAANTFAHAIFMNQKGSTFERKPLPVMGQISVVRSFTVADVDSDGKKEILTAGNFYGTDAQFGRYDASIGALWRIDQQGNLQHVPAPQSGISLPGDVRRVVSVGQNRYIVLRNNAAASMLVIRKSQIQ
jgi:hypothetical protein